MGRLLCTFACLQLANSKIYQKGFPNMWISIVGMTCLSEMPFFPSKCPPSMKSGVGFYQDRGLSWVILTTSQPCLSLKPSPHKLNPVQLFGRHSLLKTQPEEAKRAQIGHETEPSWHLPDHPDGVGPSHYPSLKCPHCEDDFYLLKCLILTFLAQDMLSQRLKTAILVTVAARYGPLRGQKVSKW